MLRIYENINFEPNHHHASTLAVCPRGIASLGETMWHESFMRFNHTQKVSFTIVFLAYFVSKGRKSERKSLRFLCTSRVKLH